MRRVLASSIVVVGWAMAGHAAAQSRTVSTAEMPKPGVSYIAGPSVPVRRETVSTGTLPEPSHFYVGHPSADPSPPPEVYPAPVDGGYAYGGGYGWNDRGYHRDDRGRDGHGRPDRDHDHDRRPPQGQPMPLSVRTGYPPPASHGSGTAFRLAPQPPPERRGWQGHPNPGQPPGGTGTLPITTIPPGGRHGR